MDNVDLEGIRETTRSLLYVEPERDGKLPMFVHHPFFQSDFVYDGGEFINLFDDIERAREPYNAIIDGADDAHGLLMLVRNPYRMLWFKMCAEYIHDDELYADILKTCWMMEEWPSRDVNVSLDEIVELFSNANRSLMVPDWVGESVTLYRGVCMGGSPIGLSWTSDIAVASKFAHRFGDDGEVYEIEARREDVLAVIDDRGEAEVVVDARKYAPERA